MKIELEKMNMAFEETKLILRVLCSDQIPESWEADRAKAGVLWRNLVIRAIVVGLAPMLRHRLLDWNVINVPPTETAKLNVTYEAHVKRNAILYRQFCEILDACHASHIQPIALKGMHLATLIYPDPGLRPMNDIDLLFTPKEIPEVEMILKKLGYVRKYTSPLLGSGITKHTTTFSRRSISPSTPNPYLSVEGEAIIEPHSSVEESWFGLKVDVTPGFHERALNAYYKGQTFHILSAEDFLLHLCVHFSFHLITGMPTLIQLLDLQMVINKEPALDWKSFISRIKETNSASFVYASLRLAKDLVTADVPVWVEEELEAEIPQRLRRRVLALDLSALLRHSNKIQLCNLRTRFERGFADRREALHWASNGKMRWNVILSGLRFWRTDLARLLLKRNPG